MMRSLALLCGAAAALRQPALRREFLAAAPLVAGAVGARPASAYVVSKSEDEWKAQLGSEGYAVLRLGATEAPNTSPLARVTDAGAYVCAACRSTLFESGAKFEARTGWPCFGAPASAGAVQVESTFLESVTGATVRCATCGGRVGERFKDGAAYPGTLAARTGTRYCCNGAALVFVPADGSPERSGELPPKLASQQRSVQDRGEGYVWQMRDGGLRPI